jgi:hypothetical protein
MRVFDECDMILGFHLSCLLDPKCGERLPWCFAQQSPGEKHEKSVESLELKKGAVLVWTLGHG